MKIYEFKRTEKRYRKNECTNNLNPNSSFNPFNDTKIHIDHKRNQISRLEKELDEMLVQLFNLQNNISRTRIKLAEIKK
jgi:hypothetical protein